MSAAGARLSARSLLRLLAGGHAVVRVPVPPPGGGDAEELGLPSPEFRDVVLAPVLVRPVASGATVLVDAGTAEAAFGQDGVEAALLAVSEVLVEGQSYRLDRTERRSIGGRAYLYRILLHAVDERGAA